MKYKFLLILFIFLLFPAKTLAQDFIISGKVTDQSNNPISKSTIEFINSSGKTIVTVETLTTGIYSISIPSDTYTISAEGPKGSNLASIDYVNKIISSDASFDFTLTDSGDSSEFVFSNRLLISIIVLLVIGISIIIGAFLIIRRNKNRKKLPESGIPN